MENNIHIEKEEYNINNIAIEESKKKKKKLIILMI